MRRRQWKCTPLRLEGETPIFRFRCLSERAIWHTNDRDDVFPQAKRVGLELAIFALIPGLGNVAERPASDLR
jgi:hypothetical protein